MDDEFLGGLMNSFAAGTIDKTIRVALSFTTRRLRGQFLLLLAIVTQLLLK